MAQRSKYAPSSEEGKEQLAKAPVTKTFVGVAVGKDNSFEYTLLVVKIRPGGPNSARVLPNYESDGFTWGYNGKGPHDTAYAILKEVFNVEVAKRLCQAFKLEIISKLAQDKGFVMTAEEVETWANVHEHVRLVRGQTVDEAYPLLSGGHLSR